MTELVEAAKLTLKDFRQSPGFMIRRAHQISESLFNSEAASLGITPSQGGALLVIEEHAPVDQIGLARALGHDRSTAGLIIANLEARGLISRAADPDDKRRKVLQITDAGIRASAEVKTVGLRVHDSLLSVFSADERAEFLRLLDKIANNSDLASPAPPLSD